MRWLSSLLGFGASARGTDGQHHGAVVDKGRKQRLDCPAHSGRRTGLFSRKLRPGSETGSSRNGRTKTCRDGPKAVFGEGARGATFCQRRVRVSHFLAGSCIQSPFPGNTQTEQAPGEQVLLPQTEQEEPLQKPRWLEGLSGSAIGSQVLHSPNLLARIPGSNARDKG